MVDVVSLVAPNGTTVSVAESRERELLAAGYRPVESAASESTSKRAESKKK